MASECDECNKDDKENGEIETQLLRCNETGCDEIICNNYSCSSHDVMVDIKDQGTMVFCHKHAEKYK